MGSRVIKLYSVSIITRTYNLGYWIWHISAGLFWINKVNEIEFKLFVSYCFGVRILGTLFFCTEKKCSLLQVCSEGG